VVTLIQEHPSRGIQSTTKHYSSSKYSPGAYSDEFANIIDNEARKKDTAIRRAERTKMFKEKAKREVVGKE
jgi:hypothetical protein